MQAPPDPIAWLAIDPDTLVQGHGPFTAAASPGDAATAFYLQDYALSSPTPWRIPSRVERIRRADWPKLHPPVSTRPPAWKPLDAADFAAVFQEIVADIRSGLFEKTVPVLTECGLTDPDGIRALIAASGTAADPLMPYGWQDGAEGFAGATPELLFDLAGTTLETMALAGTARAEDEPAFAADEKEIREHDYVSDTITSKLSPLGILTRSPREVLRLGSIIHFCTRIRLKLPEITPPQALLSLLHPTPALGPLPRTPETLGRLLGWRNRLGCPPGFGAPFGLLDHGRFRAVVAIRGAWWNTPEIRIPSGCGILDESRLVNEWRELRLKREAVKRLLGLTC